jgi:peptidoglycan/LPS O-acetylase OafA/YrhL
MATSEWIFSRPDIKSEIARVFNIQWMFMPWNLAIMFWGGLFRIWYDDRLRRCLIVSRSVPIAALVLALLLAILWSPIVLTATWIVQGKLWALHEMVPYFFGMCLFIVGALYIKLNNRFLVWLGTISYSLYLLHPIAYGFVWMLVNIKFPDWGNLHLSVYIFVSIVVSILLAGLVYYCIERPAIKLGRYLQNA